MNNLWVANTIIAAIWYATKMIVFYQHGDSAMATKAEDDFKKLWGAVREACEKGDESDGET